MTVESRPFDRAADLREDPEILDRLRVREDSAVLRVHERTVPIRDGQLAWTTPNGVTEAEWALLGRDSNGRPLLIAVVRGESAEPSPGESWLALRELGRRVEPGDRELAISALALSAWIRDSSFCPGCGSRCALARSGWSRYCATCHREHFPRIDPAVIVAVESADGDRILLGANAMWGRRMYSCFAGFVEAGESLEQTVHREVGEEAGVYLRDVRYVSSQPWPSPRSLMLGFRAVVIDEAQALPDGEEIVDVRWLTRAEIRSALDGEGPVGLPGPGSIARALIQAWSEERP